MTSASIYTANAHGGISPIPKVGDIQRGPFWRPTDTWRSGLCPWSDDCVYAAAITHHKVAIYLAKPVESDQADGVLAEKVFSVAIFPMDRGEVAADCSGWFSDRLLLFTLINRRTKTIRDFYAEKDGEIRLVAHQYGASPPCDLDPLP